MTQPASRLFVGKTGGYRPPGGAETCFHFLAKDRIAQERKCASTSEGDAWSAVKPRSEEVGIMPTRPRSRARQFADKTSSGSGWSQLRKDFLSSLSPCVGGLEQVLLSPLGLETTPGRSGSSRTAG